MVAGSCGWAAAKAAMSATNRHSRELAPGRASSSLPKACASGPCPAVLPGAPGDIPSATTPEVTAAAASAALALNRWLILHLSLRVNATEHRRRLGYPFPGLPGRDAPRHTGLASIIDTGDVVGMTR